MTMIGSISAKITADDTEFLTAMGRVKGSLKSQAAELRTSANSYAKWGAAAAAAAAVAGAAMVKNTADGIRELKVFSQVANVSTQDFQKMAYGAKTMGVEQDKLADILKDVNDRVGDFGATGGGAMADFFTNIAPKVGVTYDNFKKLSGKDALQLYVTSLEKANLSQQDMTFYMEAIASDSTQLLPLLKNNGEAMGAMGAEADKLGLALSDIDINKVEQANKQLDKSGSIISGAMQDATVALAPIITGISESLQSAAMEAGGFGKSFDKAINGAASVIGVFADGVHGIRVIVQGLQVAFWGLASIVSSAMRSAAMGIDSFISGTKENINGLIEVANKLPGVSIDLFQDTGSNISAFFKEKDGEVRASLDAAISKLDELAMKELPSASIEKWLAAVRESANEAAVAVAAAASGQQTGEGGEGGQTDSSGLTEKQKADLQAKVESIRAANLTEIELLKEKFAMEAEVLAQAYENKLLNEEAFKQQMNGITQKYSDEETAILKNAKDKQDAIDQMANKAKLNSAKTIFGGLSSLMNTESRKLFEIGKTAALANALINAYESITSSYAAGAKIGGPVLGAAYAVAAGAAQFATIQQISSQSYSKGGAGSSQVYSNGVPATNTTSEGGGQPTSRQVNISLSGSSFGAGGIRDLISEINSAVGDGVQLNAT